MLLSHLTQPLNPAFLPQRFRVDGLISNLICVIMSNAALTPLDEGIKVFSQTIFHGIKSHFKLTPSRKPNPQDDASGVSDVLSASGSF